MGKVCWTLQDYKFYTSIINIYRLGQWNAAEEEKIHFTSKARKDLSSFGIPKMYKCVVVPQQPFVFWNETKGSNGRSYQDERVILHLFLGGFDGYCIEMMWKIVSNITIFHWILQWNPDKTSLDTASILLLSQFL